MEGGIYLNNLYREYSLGILEKKQFEGLIFTSILKNYYRYHLFGWDREQCSDYFSWLYPRLSKAVTMYKDKGASFSSYINALVRWTAKEYRSRQIEHSITENAAWAAQAGDLWVYNEEPEYGEEPGPNDSPGRPVIPWMQTTENTVSNPRQLLILFLKSYYFVSDDFLDRVSSSLGIDREKLRLLIDELRSLRLKREDEARELKERIHLQFYRCIAFEKRLLKVNDNTGLSLEIQGKLDRARRRLQAMKKRLQGIKLDATNRQIAKVLNVPKGTIDSNLHALRKWWKKVQEQELN
ncbi:MAG: hypothetical protein LBL64_05540 [Treponema sp.]|jgi:hypothetical protein|nr:hypothetical protein [Treponema sp.]